MPATDDFHTCQKHLIDYYHAHRRDMPLEASSAEEYRRWAEKARAKFADLTGFDRMTPSPPNARQTGSVDCGQFTREHWLIDTEPDVTMPFWLLRPKGAGTRTPAVICCHGHGAGKDAVAGVTGDPDVAKAAKTYDYAYGAQFALAGLLAVCPDARGFGQRREEDARKNAGQSSCTFLQMAALPMGISVVGMHAFDLARLVDYLQTRDDVRGDRIGCVGFSGGGWQSLATGMLDERLACVVVSGYIHPIAAPLLFRKHNCPCNMVPHLWEHFDMGDMAALIAPRPLLVQTGDSDPLSGPDGPGGVKEQVDITRQAYRLLGCEDRLAFDVHHGGHRWNGEKPVPWVVRWLTA